MFSHMPELFIILLIALIVFGPSRLPEVASAIGKGMREFRRATSEIEDAVLHRTDTETDDFEGYGATQYDAEQYDAEPYVAQIHEPEPIEIDSASKPPLETASVPPADPQL